LGRCAVAKPPRIGSCAQARLQRRPAAQRRDLAPSNPPPRDRGSNAAASVLDATPSQIDALDGGDGVTAAAPSGIFARTQPRYAAASFA
jgi:hypothetical protein